MENFVTFVFLMFAAIILVGISQKIHIPYPIMLVLGGAAIGFIPNQHPINLDPNLLLVIVLPPVLYYAAFGLSFREFKRSWREIVSLALGLVVVTTLIIGLTFKWLFPEYPWALAFAFGAIISPPDAVAASSILKRFSLSKHLLTILEGESLFNDASALVLYRLATVALLSGIFSAYEGGLHFISTVSGGIFIGVLLGHLTQQFSRRYLEPVVGVLFSFTIPYITYILADSLGVSGVLAVVVNGLVGSQIIHKHHSSLRRILGFAVWDVFSILMNCFIFILIGLQLRTLTSMMTNQQIFLYIGYAFAITLIMISVRMFWIYVRNGIAYLRARNKNKSEEQCTQILREAALLGWSGMRGIVSLTAALALPYSLPDGMPLEGRNEAVFITFIVILLTLVIPGLTLAPLIRWLNICPPQTSSLARQVRKQLSKIAEENLQKFHAENKIDDGDFEFLRAHFNLKLRELEIITSESAKSHNLASIKSLVIQAQRRELLQIWEKLDIDDTILGQLEHELDLEETHATRVEIK